MLATMWLGLGLSALVSNVTAPLLLVEVLKPLLRDLPSDSRYSRALLLGLAFSCNVGGMMTPISSPQNVASLEALRQRGGNITWGEWLSLSVPFCVMAVLLCWLLWGRKACLGPRSGGSCWFTTSISARQRPPRGSGSSGDRQASRLQGPGSHTSPLGYIGHVRTGCEVRSRP